jgi:oligopeptide transport system substrate-binding protein
MTVLHPEKGFQGIKKSEQCLRISFKEEPSCLDPRRGRNMFCDSHLHAMLFEGLMKLEPDGSLSCAQAKSYDISPDQKTYTFHLRNTFWSDGSTVTAEDFAETWKNVLDPAFPSLDVQPFYYIKNAMAAKRGDLPLSQVGIYAKDPKTLVVELERCFPSFLQLIASSAFFPINQAKERNFPQWYLEANEHFVCNGPFKLVTWKHHNEMRLEKNSDYHCADKVKLDSIHISISNKGIASLHIGTFGLFDIIGSPFSFLPYDLCRELIKKDLLQIVNMPGTVTCTFNSTSFPFHNANIRKAFSYAINRQFLVNSLTLLKEHPALGLIPPMLKNNAINPLFKDNDVKSARAHLKKGLKELGVAAGDLDDKVTFSFWKHDHACPMLPQALQQQWKENLNVDVQLEALDFNTLHDKGKNNLFSMGYFVHFSMACDSLSLLDRFKFAYNPRNYSRWQSNAYIDLLNRAETALSQKEHLLLLEQAERLLMEEMPIAPLFHWNNALLIQPHVKGFAVSPLGYLCLDRISIKKKHSSLSVLVSL